LEVFIWRHVVNVSTSSTTFHGILIRVIFRPGICKNIFLCSVLHWRIIRFKRFFSGVHACVHGDDALTTWTLHKRPSNVYSVYEYTGTVYTCMNSWKEAFNPIILSFCLNMYIICWSVKFKSKVWRKVFLVLCHYL
jgi:hypothetical protein